MGVVHLSGDTTLMEAGIELIREEPYTREEVLQHYTAVQGAFRRYSQKLWIALS